MPPQQQLSTISLTHCPTLRFLNSPGRKQALIRILFDWIDLIEKTEGEDKSVVDWFDLNQQQTTTTKADSQIMFGQSNSTPFGSPPAGAFGSNTGAPAFGRSLYYNFFLKKRLLWWRWWLSQSTMNSNTTDRLTNIRIYHTISIHRESGTCFWTATAAYEWIWRVWQSSACAQ